MRDWTNSLVRASNQWWWSPLLGASGTRKRPLLLSPVVRIFLSPITSLNLDLIGRIKLCCCETVSCAPVFVGSCQIISFDSLQNTGPVNAPTESLRATLFEGIDHSLSWSGCWVVAGLSHPVFCSTDDLTTRTAQLDGHTLDVVEDLTVRAQRVHVEMFKSFR